MLCSFGCNSPRHLHGKKPCQLVNSPAAMGAFLSASVEFSSGLSVSLAFFFSFFSTKSTFSPGLSVPDVLLRSLRFFSIALQNPLTLCLSHSTSPADANCFLYRNFFFSCALLRLGRVLSMAPCPLSCGCAEAGRTRNLRGICNLPGHRLRQAQNGGPFLPPLSRLIALRGGGFITFSRGVPLLTKERFSRPTGAGSTHPASRCRQTHGGLWRAAAVRETKIPVQRARSPVLYIASRRPSVASR